MKNLMFILGIFLLISCEKENVIKPKKEKVEYIVNTWNGQVDYITYKVDGINNKITHQKRFGFYFKTCEKQDLMVGGRFKRGTNVELKILVNDSLVKRDTFVSNPDTVYDYLINKLKYKLKN